MPYELPSIYNPGGLNLKVPITMRALKDCIDGKNFDITASGHLVKRPGFVQKSGNEALTFNAYGLATYDQYYSQISLDTSAGFGHGAFGLLPFGDPIRLGTMEIVNRLVCLGSVPYMWNLSAISVTSSVSDTTISVFSEDDVVKCIIYDSSDAILHEFNLGTGEEVSPVMASDLTTDINALANYTASLLDSDLDFPAAFLNRKYKETLSSDPLYLVGGKWISMNPVITPLWSEMNEHLQDDDFSNATAVGMNGMLYMCNGFDNLIKFDGRNTYYAGMPSGATPEGTVTATAAPAGMSGVYKYMASYVSKDARLNEIVGGISLESGSYNNNSGGLKKISVAIASIDSNSGYDARGAIIDTTHSATDQGSNVWRIRLKADPVPTIRAGDVVIFYDDVLGSTVEKVVVAVTDNSTYYDLDITSDASVDVIDDYPVSANIRIRLYRTAGGGTTFKQLVDIPNDYRGEDAVFIDGIEDIALGTTWVDPDKYPGTPPKCKFAVVWQNSLVMAGDPNAPTTIYYSEYDGLTLTPENFPAENVILTSQQSANSAITGLAVLEETLIVFTRGSILAITGNLVTGEIDVNGVSKQTGCVSHHSIVQVERSLIFLSENGVYRIGLGSYRSFQLSLISAPIDPYFKRGGQFYKKYTLTNAIGCFWPQTDKYLLFLGSSEQSGTVEYGNTSNCIVMALKLDTAEWLKWDNINATGGLCIYESKGRDDNLGITSDAALWLQSRELNSAEDGVIGKVYRMSDTNTEIDYADHITAINMEYMGGWEFSQSPQGLKIYTELALDCFRLSSSIPFTPTGQITASIYQDFVGNSARVSQTADYISDDRRLILPLPLNQTRSITVKFSNNELNKSILISGWTFERMRQRPEIRR